MYSIFYTYCIVYFVGKHRTVKSQGDYVNSFGGFQSLTWTAGNQAAMRVFCNNVVDIKNYINYKCIFEAFILKAQIRCPVLPWTIKLFCPTEWVHHTGGHFTIDFVTSFIQFGI